mmetsp:Transcript_14027/g.26481  ORF Transcript_14027/g.26481 Transcript_14027/m.26481 type:complete len:239 (+) Transcript_14027:312-1028(+)|eukprot:CAMPEP_0197444238 /NCGR_PEP_ID=MMETSP1175-20131217/9773_1 /TAXON_ID=1003142 /ORGANISM="Triceratium dubium, Strain CCMP147" /LENGTH=238 /DNA_ID=CAMNT_0042974995 /DNA_START=308 /DNA_END=1024 /DNA_ORIENTATION=-
MYVPSGDAMRVLSRASHPFILHLIGNSFIHSIRIPRSNELCGRKSQHHHATHMIVYRHISQPIPSPFVDPAPPTLQIHAPAQFLRHVFAVHAEERAFVPSASPFLGSFPAVVVVVVVVRTSPALHALPELLVAPVMDDVSAEHDVPRHAPDGAQRPPPPIVRLVQADVHGADLEGSAGHEDRFRLGAQDGHAAEALERDVAGVGEEQGAAAMGGTEGGGALDDVPRRLSLGWGFGRAL